MIRRFPVRLEIVTPGARADALVAEASALLGAETLPSAAGEVCLSVAGVGLRDATRRAERMLAGQGFGWSAHVRVAAVDDGFRRVPLPPAGRAPRGLGRPDRPARA